MAVINQLLINCWSLWKDNHSTLQWRRILPSLTQLTYCFLKCAEWRIKDLSKSVTLCGETIKIYSTIASSTCTRFTKNHVSTTKKSYYGFWTTSSRMMWGRTGRKKSSNRFASNSGSTTQLLVTCTIQKSQTSQDADRRFTSRYCKMLLVMTSIKSTKAINESLWIWLRQTH